MTLEQLQAFLAVAESHSFTKAAEKLFVTPSSLSQQIAGLEQDMGVPLFYRRSRPIRLTPAGQVLRRRGAAVLVQFEQTVSEARKAELGLSGSLRVGYIKGYERSDLSVLLRRFHLEYPDVHISCHRGTADELARDLTAGQYDIIFTPDSTGLRHLESYTSVLAEKTPLVAALYSGHPLAEKRSLSREDLKDEPLLNFSSTNIAYSMEDSRYLELYLQAGYKPNILLSSNDFEDILMMVAAEEGISILPRYCTRRLIRAENLTFIPLRGKVEVTEVYAIYNNSGACAAARRLSELLPFEAEGSAEG